MAQDQRVVFYSASFFKIDGVTLTIRGLIRHITQERGGRVLVLTADDPADSVVDAFTEASGGRAEVLRAAGGLVPAPGADYFMGLYLTRSTKEALEAYSPTVVHITNPDLVALWVSFFLGGRMSLIDVRSGRGTVEVASLCILRHEWWLLSGW